MVDLSGFELFPGLLRGALITVQITVMAGALAFFLSFVIAFARISNSAFVRAISTVYVEVFRGTSALVQLFYLFYILPIFGVTLPPVATAVAGLGLNAAAYGSEIVRSALLSISKGQREAGLALGLRNYQIMRRILIPQAMVLILPAFGNLLVELVKASSLVSLITLSDLTFSGVQIVLSTGRVLETWTLVLFLYFCIAFPLSMLAGAAERRANRFRAGNR